MNEHVFQESFLLFVSLLQDNCKLVNELARNVLAKEKANLISFPSIIAENEEKYLHFWRF